jgi:hypothetical protein
MILVFLPWRVQSKGSKAEFITAAVVEIVKHGLLTGASLKD